MACYVLMSPALQRRYGLQENQKLNVALLLGYENTDQTERDTTAKRQSAIDKFISLWVSTDNSNLFIFSPVNNQRQWSNNHIKFAIISLIPVSIMKLSG